MSSIGSHAFDGCAALTSIELPCISTLSESAFTGCSNLTTAVISGPITVLSHGLFMNCEKLSSVTFPSAVTSFGRWTFYGCSSLTKITFPDSLNYIDEYAFLYTPISMVDCTRCQGIPNLQVNLALGTIFSPMPHFYVPESLYSSWRTAPNWSTYSSYIHLASELPTEE